MMHRCLAFVATLVSIQLHAGEKKIVLRDGSTRIARTTMLGNPAHHRSDKVEIESIRPSIDRLDGWRTVSQFWKFEFILHDRARGALLVDSPYAPDRVLLGFIMGKPGYVGNWEYKDEAFDKAINPEMWHWLNEPGETWIPFHFQLRNEHGEITEEFDDWARITDKEKVKAKRDMEALNKPPKGVVNRSIIMPNGENLTFCSLDGSPMRYSDDWFQVDEVFPTIAPSKDHVRRIPIWVVKGRFRKNTERTITLTCPWMDSQFKQTAIIHGPGQSAFTIPFAAKDETPLLWEWLKTPGETRIPIHIHLDDPSYPKGLDLVEWSRIDEKEKSEFLKLISKISG